MLPIRASEAVAVKKRLQIKKRLFAVLAAALALLSFTGSAGAEYVVMPSMVSSYVDAFNAKSAALGLRYTNMRFTHISYSKKSAAFALRGPDSLDYAYSNTMELSLHGEHDNQLVTSVTITAAPLKRETASTEAYRQEFTTAALITLESLVTGVTRFEAARVLASLEMPFDYNVLSSALGLTYGSSYALGYPYANSYPYSSGFPYMNPVLTDKGVSVSETLNNYPVTLTAEIESNGTFTMTAQLAGVYPYPTSSLYPNLYSYPGQNPFLSYPQAGSVITLSPGVTSDVIIGGEFIVRLEYTQGDGYDWEYDIEGAALTLISEHTYTTQVLPYTPKGVHEWRFAASEFGSSTLAFAYVNSSGSMAQGSLFYVNAY